jgi:hypothetical protein
MANVPRQNDVVVHKFPDARSKTPYGIGRFQAPVQYALGSYGDARSHADAFARHYGVDVWYTEDGDRYDCVACRRSAVSEIRRRATSPTDHEVG